MKLLSQKIKRSIRVSIEEDNVLDKVVTIEEELDVVR